MKQYFIIFFLFLSSCHVPTKQISYLGDRLVVFANININAIDMDPIYISKSANINYSDDVSTLYISDAYVMLEEICDGIPCCGDSVTCQDCSSCWEISGCWKGNSDDICDGEIPYYKFSEAPLIKPETKYRLTVENINTSHSLINNIVKAETTTPTDFSFS